MDIDSRNARIVAHAKAGRTMTEIIDIEGLDASNKMTFHRTLTAAGVKSAVGRPSDPPLGMALVTKGWLASVRFLVEDLAKDKTNIEMSRLLGMTNKEVTASLKDEHNWTIAQLARLGKAQGMTFEDVLNHHTTIKKLGFA